MKLVSFEWFRTKTRFESEAKANGGAFIKRIFSKFVKCTLQLMAMSGLRSACDG